MSLITAAQHYGLARKRYKFEMRIHRLILPTSANKLIARILWTRRKKRSDSYKTDWIEGIEEFYVNQDLCHSATIFLTSTTNQIRSKYTTISIQIKHDLTERHYIKFCEFKIDLSDYVQVTTPNKIFSKHLKYKNHKGSKKAELIFSMKSTELACRDADNDSSVWSATASSHVQINDNNSSLLVSADADAEADEQHRRRGQKHGRSTSSTSTFENTYFQELKRKHVANQRRLLDSSNPMLNGATTASSTPKTKPQPHPQQQQQTSPVVIYRHNAHLQHQHSPYRHALQHEPPRIWSAGSSPYATPTRRMPTSTSTSTPTKQEPEQEPEPEQEQSEKRDQKQSNARLADDEDENMDDDRDPESACVVYAKYAAPYDDEDDEDENLECKYEIEENQQDDDVDIDDGLSDRPPPFNLIVRTPTRNTSSAYGSPPTLHHHHAQTHTHSNGTGNGSTPISNATRSTTQSSASKQHNSMSMTHSKKSIAVCSSTDDERDDHDADHDDDDDDDDEDAQVQHVDEEKQMEEEEEKQSQQTRNPHEQDDDEDGDEDEQHSRLHAQLTIHPKQQQHVLVPPPLPSFTRALHRNRSLHSLTTLGSVDLDGLDLATMATSFTPTADGTSYGGWQQQHHQPQQHVQQQSLLSADETEELRQLRLDKIYYTAQMAEYEALRGKWQRSERETDKLKKSVQQLHDDNNRLRLKVSSLTLVIEHHKNERNNSFATFTYFDEAQCARLSVHDYVDHRDDTGHFLLARILQRRAQHWLIHYEGWGAKWDAWLDYAEQSAQQRLAPARSVSRKSNTRFVSIAVGDAIDVYPSQRHPHWLQGTLKKMDRFSGQVQVQYAFRNETYFYWAHLNNVTEIAAFMTKSCDASEC